MELEVLRNYCLSLTSATEDIKWENNLVFSIGGKMFCIADLEPPFRFSFKVKDEDFEEVCNREGFIPAPYLARAKWVTVTDPSVASRLKWQQYLKESYQLVISKLPKKVRAELEARQGESNN